ncbi:MAG: hypothetical protein WKF89_16120 [Chitinophagaceae bacterium]
MKKTFQFFTLIGLLFLVQCRTSRPSGTVVGVNSLQAVIIKQGILSCFEPGLTTNGQPVWCEASAILYDGKNLLMANDKDMPDNRSAVFSWTYKNGFADTASEVQYLKNPVLKYGKKYEDFALSPNGKVVFLTTAFDRVKPGTSEWNAYNTLLYWQAGNQMNPSVLRLNQADSSSVFMRELFSKALVSAEFPDGMPYFKIEGLAATNDMLYFGIREEGKKFDEFKYKVKILTVPYTLNNGAIALGSPFKVLADINLASIDTSLNKSMGISSIEYDHYNNRFLLLTSFENGQKLGGYLWTATQEDLENNKINLVKDQQGLPLSFSNKSEDVAIINGKKIIVIHDDDRVQTTVGGQVRQSNQAAYSIVEFR